MLYKYTRGEVQLSALETENEHAVEKKRFVYPLCIENRHMLAIAPTNCNIKSASWNCGAFGIAEPDPEQGKIVEPEEIDLVICPCSSFDECGHRLGMGGGYYDRFLPSCTKATVIAVAFETQKSEMVPARAWDVPVEMVVTEQRVIDRLLRK